MSGPQRLASCPEVPTFKELGIPALAMTQWYALFAPAKTPYAVTRRLNTALNAVLADPDVVSRMAQDGATVQSSTPGELHDLLLREGEKWQDVVARTGLRLSMSVE